jgi:Protein of unknown function (DUF3572)
LVSEKAKIFLFDDNVGVRGRIIMRNRQEAAEILALQALGWLVAHEELVNAFLGASGLTERDLPRAASRPDTLAAVLDFLLEDETRLLAFCADAGISPENPMAARALLPGGDVPHWT